MKTIVVGVDGSQAAAAALEFAAGEAVLREARLRVVCAWEIPVVEYGDGFVPPPAPETVDALRVRARQIADDALATAQKLQPPLEGEALAVEGQAADALLEQADSAELIVVGSRGLGGFKSLLLGSVSQQVVHHATCPVVVVHQPAATQG
jgi:nucleotide-binding universal stress UspA family protein